VVAEKQGHPDVGMDSKAASDRDEKGEMAEEGARFR